MGGIRGNDAAISTAQTGLAIVIDIINFCKCLDIGHVI